MKDINGVELAVEQEVLISVAQSGGYKHFLREGVVTWSSLGVTKIKMHHTGRTTKLKNSRTEDRVYIK